MNFKHKLSARLARLKDLVVFAALAATACERPVLTGSGDAVTRLVVFPRNLTVHPSDTAQLMAVAFTSSGDTGSISVNWSVTGGSIIGTSTSGGRHYGRFQAASQPGKVDVIAGAAVAAPLADTAVVAVTPVPVASVAVAPAVMSMLVGATAQLAAVTLDSAGSILSGRTVTWGSSAPTVAFVNSVGLVTAAAAGSATITATSEGQAGSSAVTVTNVSAPVASVTVTPGSASIQSGQRLQLTATPRDANGNVLGGRAITWGSSNATVVAVDGSGLVTAGAAGSATITATSEGQSGSSSITVTSAPVPVASVTVAPPSAGVQVGQTVQLTATPRDASGSPLTGRTVAWSSSNTGVAAVTGTGLVTGVGAGSATVTATSEGKSGTSSVTVTAAPPASVAAVTVSPASAYLLVGTTVQLLATPRDSAGNAVPGKVVSWSSSAPSLATVTASGLVTGVAAGSVTITASSDGKSGTASIIVDVGGAGHGPVGIWITPAEIAALPTSGPAWNALNSWASQTIASPDLSDQNDPDNVITMAKALVYARTGNATYRLEVLDAITRMMGTEATGRTLALGRELIAYVIAADLVGLPADLDLRFRTFLVQVRTENLQGNTLISTNEDRPNNWGMHAGATRMAVARYLGDTADLARAAQVFKGWLGDRNSYAGFTYGDLAWQSDPQHPVGINPLGATIQGHSVDGVLPDDQRRSGGFTWPPPKENYVYEALQGALSQAVILHRAGYDVWNWSDRALLRAYQWLYTQCNFAAVGDDTWEMPLVDYYYGTHFWDGAATTPGKGVGFTDWTDPPK